MTKAKKTTTKTAKKTTTKTAKKTTKRTATKTAAQKKARNAELKAKAKNGEIVESFPLDENLTTKPKAKPKPPTKRKPEHSEEKLYCTLTEREHRDRAETLARTVRERNTITEDKKAAAAEFKAQVDDRTQQIDKLAEVVRSGKELRDVDCEWRFDFKKNEKSLVRFDTKEVVRRLTLTKRELQIELPV